MKPESLCGRRLLSLLLLPLLFSCSGTKPENLGISDSRLATCPSSPNCVSSDASDADHQIAPFYLKGPAADVWRETNRLITNMPRTNIITFENNYLHAECRSAIFGFVDDLELHLRPEENIIAVRSAARLGTSDLGVNRKRVEELRSKLTTLGLITAAH
jgi:uncharacterized protein (DUF1499 family)